MSLKHIKYIVYAKMNLVRWIYQFLVLYNICFSILPVREEKKILLPLSGWKKTCISYKNIFLLKKLR